MGDRRETRGPRRGNEPMAEIASASAAAAAPRVPAEDNSDDDMEIGDSDRDELGDDEEDEPMVLNDEGASGSSSSAGDKGAGGDENAMAGDSAAVAPAPVAPAPAPAKPFVRDMNRTRVGGQYAAVDLTKRGEAVPLPKNVHDPRFGESLAAINAQDVLSNAEVAIALSEVEELNNATGGGAGLGGDEDNVFELTRAYVTAFSGTRDPTYKKEEVRALKLKLQEKEFVRFSEHDHTELDPAVLEPFEIAALCDLKVETIEEVRELIPSVGKRFDDSDIVAILDMIKGSAARA